MEALPAGGHMSVCENSPSARPRLGLSRSDPDTWSNRRRGWWGTGCWRPCLAQRFCGSHIRVSCRPEPQAEHHLPGPPSCQLPVQKEQLETAKMLCLCVCACVHTYVHMCVHETDECTRVC